MKKERSKLNLFVQGSFFLVLSNVCIKAINFFLLPLYTKNLTPSMLGVSDSITSFTGILFPILVLGLDSAYSAFYFDNNDEIRDKKVFSTIGIVLFLLGFIPIAMCFFSKHFSMILFKNNNYSLIVIIALLGVSLNLWALPFSLELRLKNKMGRFGVVSIVASVSMIGLNVLFVSVLKLNEISLVLSTSIVGVVYFLLYSIFIGHFPKIRYFDKVLLKRMLIFALPIIPSVVMAWVLSLSDRYILLHYCGDTAVGLYGIGARFVTLLNVVVNAITTAYTTFAFSTKDDEDAKRNYYYIFNILSCSLILISFTLALFSKEIIILMTDDSYYSSYEIIRDMMYGQVLYAMSTIVSYGIIFKKKSGYSLIAVSCGAIVNLILNFIFIPRYGLIAAAFTTLIGYFISMIVTYYFSEKLYPCNYGISKVGILFLITYLISFLLKESNMIIRIFVWITIFVIFIILYKDLLVNVFNLVRDYLKNKTNVMEC